MMRPHPVVTLAASFQGHCLLVHGGAGAISRERREAHAEGCRHAARAGGTVLARGGSVLDAVVAAVRVLEDDPLFNAGRGACLNAEERIEHDASIMEGSELRAGAVGALAGFSSPIAVARAVLDDGRHVFLAGEGAAAFARARGFEAAPAGTLVTDAAREALARWRAGRAPSGWAGNTVGAVACDGTGRCAAATSTGGIIGKLPGRIGDSPIVGAGTYADDEAGAVSTTGDGEAMIRLGSARSAIEALRRGGGAEDAARSAIDELAARLAATGGLVLVRRGEWALARSTATLSWAVATPAGEQGGC
ncbi:MAG: isoaspartyl peptidase/L-asparaginase [Polyangiaceae bacterium]